MNSQRLSLALLAVICCFLHITYRSAHAQSAADQIDYHQDVAPILKKYCAGCHNDSDLEGDFSVSSLDKLRAGTPDGDVLSPGKPQASKLLQLLLSQSDEQMPPADEPQPSEADLLVIQTWIAQGAAGDAAPASMDLVSKLTAPKLAAAPRDKHYVGAACLVGGSDLALGTLNTVELRNANSNKVIWKCDSLPGKVNALRLSPDGKLLIASGGIAGIGGEVTLLDASDGSVIKRLQAHQDIVYCASMSPDGRWLASGSYDRNVILWDVATGEQVRQFTGHNGAIYDLDFDPTGKALATASADQTVKLWNVSVGIRLDTFGQPEGEMRCVRFSRDGKYVFAGGADRQIRKWKILSTEKPAINPMTVARFAHESDVLQLQLLDENRIASTARDLTLKLWDVAELKPLGKLGQLADVPAAICIADQNALQVVELTGAIRSFSANSVSSHSPKPLAGSSPAIVSAAPEPQAIQEFQEMEPNNTLAAAQAIGLPAHIRGVIYSESGEDDDLFRFSARSGQTWIFEVDAAKHNSPLDSRVEILDAAGQPVLRTQLQAVRESYFTFRGKDSDTIDDFRMHKWEDMELDEYLYSSGEVVKLWLYPRGPDSGFKVYPGAGKRTPFFDTTPVAHALGEPAYIVRELQPGEQPLPNGLPVFPVYFENDDDALRRAGRDSRLTFTAPADGQYFIRVRDARGFGSQESKYELTIRPANPDFSVAVSGEKMNIAIGTGREWTVSATRDDGLDSPISITLEGLPAGLLATNPLVIEAGQISAKGTIYATNDATALAASEPKTNEVVLVATSTVDGRKITHQLEQKLQIQVVPAGGMRFDIVDAMDPSQPLAELTIRPGQTISAGILLERADQSGPISFGKEDSGRGLPHGAYVDNIGLNGLLIPAEQTQREFFITAAPKLRPGRYQFHLRAESGDNPTSRPIWLVVE
ncbi:MAG: c-type cytochrome domain-containing protein [Pirellulaceae bacterium]